jgi:hypothetical protein
MILNVVAGISVHRGLRILRPAANVGKCRWQQHLKKVIRF